MIGRLGAVVTRSATVGTTPEQDLAILERTQTVQVQAANQYPATPKTVVRNSVMNMHTCLARYYRNKFNQLKLLFI